MSLTFTIKRGKQTLFKHTLENLDSPAETKTAKRKPAKPVVVPKKTRTAKASTTKAVKPGRKTAVKAAPSKPKATASTKKTTVKTKTAVPKTAVPKTAKVEPKTRRAKKVTF